MQKIYESGIYHYGERATISVVESQIANVSRAIHNEASHLFDGTIIGGSMGAEKITLKMMRVLIFLLLCALATCQLSLLIEITVGNLFRQPASTGKREREHKLNFEYNKIKHLTITSLTGNGHANLQNIVSATAVPTVVKVITRRVRRQR